MIRRKGDRGEMEMRRKRAKEKFPIVSRSLEHCGKGKR